MSCLIVPDSNMPGMNGADILKEIGSNKQYGDIPKIVWSTWSSDKFKKFVWNLGAADYVIKPSKSIGLEKNSPVYAEDLPCFKNSLLGENTIKCAKRYRFFPNHYIFI